MTKISQAEISVFLKKNKGKWFTVKQLAKELKINNGSCLNNLLRLRRHRNKIIKTRKSEKVKNAFEYSYEGEQ
ncbi:hypothetical protein LCGC14_1301830 [marine sediment metagenome]|uniref:HTH marR-type domain-containing protein n=1 Tax=marine sediment metagenome TaxID=412755 RepID=A0A0F9KQR5_9ZZZZ